MPKITESFNPKFSDDPYTSTIFLRKSGEESSLNRIFFKKVGTFSSYSKVINLTFIKNTSEFSYNFFKIFLKFLRVC